VRVKAITFATILTLALVGFMWYRSYVAPISVARWTVYGQSNDHAEGVGELITSERGSIAWLHSGRGPETAGPVTAAWWRLASPIKVLDRHSATSTEEWNERFMNQMLDESVNEQRKLIPRPQWGIHADMSVWQMWRTWEVDAFNVTTSYSTIFSFITALYVLYLLTGRLRRYLRLRQGHCSACGYCMKGNVSGACPECGAAYAPMRKLDGEEIRPAG
jgi:hypothetical protein